jgi:hypothetical protein
MPWLHLIFEAWEDYRAQREADAVERKRQEVASAEFAGLSEAEDDDGKRKKNKKKK